VEAYMRVMQSIICSAASKGGSGAATPEENCSNNKKMRLPAA